MVNNSDREGTVFKIKRFSIHDGPGIRTSVFLKGCPLQCIWCHSPEGISSEISIWYNSNLCIACAQCTRACPEKALELTTDPKPFIKIDRNLCRITGSCVKVCPANAIQFTGEVMKASEIIREVEKDILFYHSSGGGVTLTGGEPLYQPDFSAGILLACKDKDIHTAIETCLFCDKDAINIISEFIDLFIIDLKIFNNEEHLSYTGKTNETIKDNFRYIAQSGKPIIVRIPLIKNITDSPDNRKSILRFVNEINKEIPVEFIHYNKLAGNNYDKLGMPFLYYEK